MNLAELQKALRAVDEAAVLVSPRILERVVRDACALPGFSWNVPHAKTFVAHRQQLFRHAEQADLELAPDQLLPETVILLARPSNDELSWTDRSRDATVRTRLLLKYWRRLFHARVHLALMERQAAGLLTAEGVAARAEEIGRTEFEEIRAVLVRDEYLPAGTDDLGVYIEFAAVYLELRYFAANLLPNYFPGIRDFGRVEALLGRDVDAPALFNATRLADAADPNTLDTSRSEDSYEAFKKLVDQAERSARRGNIVRAAILHTRAARIAPAALTLPTRAAAEGDIRELTRRLDVALGLGEAEAAEWARYLNLLLDKADQGKRPVEAQLLDDLQAACEDSEHEVYTLDLMEWMQSGGKRPIKRPLPSLRWVRITKQLRAATQKLGTVRLSEKDRTQLTRLVQGALHRSEEALRGRFRPVLETAMQDVGLVPHTPPERAAFAKMVEEMLDRIVAFGYLTFSDLRDTIARNQLKLPDLRDAQDFLRGDALLRLDQRLASLLDGVYRPGEFYVKWLEWFTALNFGTVTGRLFMLWFALPFGGAFLLLKAVEMVLEYIPGVPKPPEGQAAPLAPLAFLLEDVPRLEEPRLARGVGWGLVAALGLLLLGLLHSEWLRHVLWKGCRLAWRGLRGLFYDLPRRVLPLDELKRLFLSVPFQVLDWYLLRPLALTCLLWWIWRDFYDNWFVFAGTFAVLLVALNSRVGQTGMDKVRDGLVYLVEMLRDGLLQWLIRFTVWLFKALVDAIDYTIYTVSEWLRYRGGDSRALMVVRTVLGVLWLPVAAVLRFYMVVLIEPGINPLKFPISSLAAKFIYPSTLWKYQRDQEFRQELIGPFVPFVGEEVAHAVVLFHLFWLPDVFGFLFWEVSRNWLLYRANRSRVLRPAAIGAHGETVRNLLQPGFHSGTIPRLYARLRAAEADAARTGRWHSARSLRHELDEVAHTVQRFVTRELVDLLRQSTSWRGVPLGRGEVRLAINRISFELTHGEYPTRPVEVELERRGPWLVAGLRQTGWLDQLRPEQLRAFTTALAGFYKLSGIDLVREQVWAHLPPGAESFDVTAEGLAVRYGPGPPVVYNLRDEARGARPPLGLGRLMFGRRRLTWEEWVQSWQKDQDGEGHPGLPGLGEELVRLPVAGPPPVTPAPAADGFAGVAV